MIYTVSVMITTTIRLNPETRDKLKHVGHKDQTYNDIVNVLLDRFEYGENQ